MEPRDWLLLFIAEKVHGRYKLDRIRVMKGMFIFSQESGLHKGELYGFEPFHYGPCSFDIYDDLDNLKDEGLIVEDPPGASWGHFEVTGRGTRKAEEIAEDAESEGLEFLRAVKAFTMTYSFKDLLRAIYKEYPDYASRTVLPHLT